MENATTAEDHLTELFKLKTGDLLILVLCALLSIMPLVIDFEKPGQKYQVKVKNEIVATGSLAKDTVFSINTSLDSVKIGVDNESIRILKSSCPHKYCIEMGKTDSPNKPLVCIPNRLIVEVISEEKTGDVDAILK